MCLVSLESVSSEGFHGCLNQCWLQLVLPSGHSLFNEAAVVCLSAGGEGKPHQC